MALQSLIAEIKNPLLISTVKKLYTSSFPKRERIPFKILLKLCKRGKVDLLIFTDVDIFVGFAFIIKHKDIVFILYFAINDTIRGKGYGGKALQTIKNKYSGKRIILNIESTQIIGSNHEERVKRKNFYMKNGYKEAKLFSRERGEIFEMLILNGIIEKEEYCNLLKTIMGRLVYWIFGPNVFENNF